MRSRISGVKATLAVSLILITLIPAGCGKSSQQPNVQQQSAQQQQTQEKVPEKLKKIEARLETLFETLGAPSIKIEENEGGKTGGTGQGQQSSQQSSQKSSQQSSQQSTQQSSQQSSQQSTQQQGTKPHSSQQSTKQQGTKKKSNKTQPAKQQGTMPKGTQLQGTVKWTEVDTLISNLHYQWNDYMPEITKKGAAMKLVDNFDNALNQLTTVTVSKDSEKALKAANMLYSYIPDLYSLYRTKMSPEVKRMVYYTRSIILEAKIDNWGQVKKDNDAMEKSWALFHNTLDTEQKQIGDKLDFSIYELSKVVNEKNKHLTDIKGRIVLSNIQELEKSFEKKEKEKK